MAEVADVGFEAVAAVREFPSYRGQRHFPGWYYAATMNAHDGFESWPERDHAILLDSDPQVTGFASQPLRLTWRDAREGRERSHAPDFFARLAEGTGLVVDSVRSAGGTSGRWSRARLCGWWRHMFGFPESATLVEKNAAANVTRVRGGPQVSGPLRARSDAN